MIHTYVRRADYVVRQELLRGEQSMFKKRHFRMLIGCAAAVLLIAGTNTQAQAQAQAEDDIGINGIIYADVITNTYAGHGIFNQDPNGSIPGDSIRACDIESDGLSIKVWLSTNSDIMPFEASTSTAGHTAGYCTGWKHENATEGAEVYIQACAQRDGRTLYYSCAYKFARA